MSLKILLVDDNRTFLAAVTQCLAMVPNTCVVGQAHDGPDALAQAQALQPDLVLLDIVMPHMTGLQVATHMQRWPQVPRILFLTLHANASYRAAARDLGAVALVDKANFVTDLMPIVAKMAAGLAIDQTADLAAPQPAAVPSRGPRLTDTKP